MKKRLFLAIIIMFTVSNGGAQQNKMKMEDIKEIWVYDYFDTKGYTRGEVYRKFQELENEKVSKIKLEQIFVNSLKNMLVYSAIYRKSPHGKCGTQLVFAQFILRENISRKIIINSIGIEDYFAGNRQYYFVDNHNRNDKTLWLNNYFYKIIDMINSKTE